MSSQPPWLQTATQQGIINLAATITELMQTDQQYIASEMTHLQSVVEEAKENIQHERAIRDMDHREKIDDIDWNPEDDPEYRHTQDRIDQEHLDDLEVNVGKEHERLASKYPLGLLEPEFAADLAAATQKHFDRLLAAKQEGQHDCGADEHQGLHTVHTRHQLVDGAHEKQVDVVKPLKVTQQNNGSDDDDLVVQDGHVQAAFYAPPNSVRGSIAEYRKQLNATRNVAAEKLKRAQQDGGNDGAGSMVSSYTTMDQLLDDTTASVVSSGSSSWQVDRLKRGLSKYAADENAATTTMNKEQQLPPSSVPSPFIPRVSFLDKLSNNVHGVKVVEACIASQKQHPTFFATARSEHTNMLEKKLEALKNAEKNGNNSPSDKIVHQVKNNADASLNTKRSVASCQLKFQMGTGTTAAKKVEFIPKQRGEKWDTLDLGDDEDGEESPTTASSKKRKRGAKDDGVDARKSEENGEVVDALSSYMWSNDVEEVAGSIATMQATIDASKFGAAGVTGNRSNSGNDNAVAVFRMLHLPDAAGMSQHGGLLSYEVIEEEYVEGEDDGAADEDADTSSKKNDKKKPTVMRSSITHMRKCHLGWKKGSKIVVKKSLEVQQETKKDGEQQQEQPAVDSCGAAVPGAFLNAVLKLGPLGEVAVSSASLGAQLS